MWPQQSDQVKHALNSVGKVPVLVGCSYEYTYVKTCPYLERNSDISLKGGSYCDIFVNVTIKHEVLILNCIEFDSKLLRARAL